MLPAGPQVEAAVLLKLDSHTRRVFGVLLEKSLAQPSYYPMTLNAILAACNQKSNREPVLELNEDAVWQALETLRQAGLISKLLPGMAGRVERYKHEAKTVLAWEKPQRAVMAELLLRGPQTLGELRTRCSRMFPFESTEAVAAVLEALSRTEPPTIAALPRAAGQSATRYTDLLSPATERAADVSATDTHVPEPPSSTRASAGAPPRDPAVAPPAPAATPAAHEAFQHRFEQLETEIRALRALVTDLKQRLARLEGPGPQA